MKPLTEWTTEELREEIYDGHYDRENMVDELLRRERAKCVSQALVDDGEPLTRDRFFALGWQDAGGLWCSPPTPTGECVTLDYHDNRESGDVYRLIRCGGLPRVEVSTVGELRRLCDALGVPLHPATLEVAR